MADVRPLLLEFLRSIDGDQELSKSLATDAADRLAEALDGVDLAQARIAANEDPTSAEAAARVIARMILDRVGAPEVVDAAKLLAGRAPRTSVGAEVALVCGAVLSSLTDQPQLAEPYYRRVRREDPGHPQVLAFYRKLFADNASATQLIQVLVQARRASRDPQIRFALAEEVADVAEHRLGSADRVIEMWRAVLREDGYDSRATEALMRLYRAGGKWTALVDLLKDELDRMGEGPEHAASRIEKLLEIANLYRERLNLDTMALATLQRILEIDPRHEASLDALSETYARAQRWGDLLGVYARRIETAHASGEQARQIDLLRKSAEIWMEKLGNPQRALEPLAQVLELAPRDFDSRELLARIHEQRRDFRALIALRREELPERAGEEALELRIELARLAEDRLGDRSEAIDAWNEVLAHHGDVDRALAALARLYEREGRWANAAEILHRKLTYCTPEEAVRLLLHLGNLYTDRLQSREDAVAVWRELLRLDPGHDKATRRLRDAFITERHWDDLTALYARQGRLADVVEVLQSAADRIGEVAERVALYRRVAALCQTKLGQPERALKALERTLAIAPDNFEVAKELLPIYREQSNWARLMSTYEVLLRTAKDDVARLELIAAMQDVAEHKLASPTLTLQWAAEAYRLRPSEDALRAALEHAAERADGWDELTAIYEERIGADGVSPDEQLLLLGKLAVTARDRLFKPDDAQRYFRRIIAVSPSNQTAMAALEDIYSSTRRWDDLGEVYRRRLEVTEDPDARLVTLRSLARIQEHQLGDLEQAVASHQAILEIVPEDAEALDALAQIHRNRGSWSALAGVLERQLELTDVESVRIPVTFELGQIHASRLGDADRAVGEFLAVLAMDPNHRASVEALEGLRQAEPKTSLSVMRGLLPYYRRVENRPREAEAMEVIVAAEQDERERLGQLEQLAAIYERMPHRREDALRIRDELFRADPSKWQGRQVLVRLGSELGRMPEVAAAYEAVLGAMGEQARIAESEGRTASREQVTLRRDLTVEYASMLRDTVDRPRVAERAFAEVLDMDETHQGAYEALEALLQARSANEELVTLYRRRVDVTFNQREQKELLSRVTEICRHVLGDRRTALATAEELLDLIPDDLGTIALLGQMYAEGTEPEDAVKLEEILGRQVELTRDPAQARKLRVRRAALRMQYLGDAFGAVDLLGQVLGEDPQDEEARRLLEELLAISEVQLQACALLEPIYARLGDHEGRIRVLHVRRGQAEGVGSVDEAVSYLLEIARLREHEQGDPAAAFDVVREAYLMDPTRFDTRQEVERLGLLLRRFAELAEVWQDALGHERVSDAALCIDLTTRLARLHDRHLRDQEVARQVYGDLLALDPPDARLAREAVEALCRLHLEAGDEVALIESKRQLLRFCDTPSDQVAIRLEIADIQEQLRDRVGAALTYSEVLDMQPASAEALGALERLFFEEKEWGRLVEVLEHRIGFTSDPRVRAGVWRRVGELRRDRLQEPEAAVAAFQSVLDLKVGREETSHALGALIELHEAAHRWPDVEEGLRRLTSIADSEEQRVALLTRTAIVVGRHLLRGSDALDLLKRVLDLSPTDTRARSEVSGYLEQDETRERAIRILTPLYEAEQNWPALLELEELQARKQPSGRRRLQALLRVARTQEERIGDSDRAFAVLCEAMAEAADQPELEEILATVERLGAESERAEGLLDAYGATIDHILDASLQRRVLRSQGRVALDRLGRLDVARGAYERVIEGSPDDAEAGEALEQIYLRQDAYEPLAQLLVGRAERASSEQVRDQELARAAQIYQTHLERHEDAIVLYERLSAQALSRPEIQDVLEPLYEATGRWRELAAHLNRKLTSLQGIAAVNTHLRLGRLYGQELEDPEAGIRHMSAALKLDPDHAVATQELDRYLEDPSMRARVAEMLEPVFAAVADWNRLIQIQEIRLAHAADEESRMRILLRIAQIEEEQLEDLERAMHSYERLFGEQPKSRYVRDQLSRLSGVLGQSARYAELLTEYVQGDGVADDSDEMLSIVREAADLWSGILRRPAEAVPLLNRILLARPEHPDSFPALEVALTRAQMWRELTETYWREADAAVTEDHQIDLLRRLATVAQEMIEDPDEAARAYQRMLEIRPDASLARARLEQVFAQTGRHQDLMDLLRENMVRCEAIEDRTVLALRIAALQNEALEDPDGAVDTLESVLAEAPDDPRAVHLLERIAQGRRTMRTRVLAVLRPIYERTGNVRRLVEIDEWQLGQVEDPLARHELFREMAQLLTQSGATAEAGFRVLCRALAEPGPEDLLEALDQEVSEVAERLDVRSALADALVAASTAQALESDIDRRLQLLVRGARLQHELGDPAVAVETLESALMLSDEHRPALALLDVALVRLGHHDALTAVLRKRVRVAEDDGERIDLLRRMACLFEEVLVRPEQAEQAWKELLQIEPSDREALQRLSRVYEASGSTQELIDVLERQIESSAETSERRDLRMQLATLLREGVKDRTAEIDVLRALLVEEPSDDDALAALARALVAEERHAEAVDVIQERATLATADERRTGLLLESARLFAGALEDIPSALERYEQVLLIQPGHDAALGDLVVLAKKRDCFDSAGNLVLQPLAASGRHAELAEVLEARAEFTADPDDRAETLGRLARLRMERLDDVAGALRAYNALLDAVEPPQLRDVLEHGGRLAVQLGEGGEHVQMLAERAGSTELGNSARVVTALYASNLAQEILGDADRALELLIPLIEGGLATPTVCAAVERLGERTGRLDAMEMALREGSRLNTDATMQAATLVRLGHVQIRRDDLKGAIDSLRDAFDVGRDSAAIVGLEQVLERSGDEPPVALLDALDGAYQATTDRVGQAKVAAFRLRVADPIDKPRLLEHLAILRDDGGGTVEEALETWGELLAHDPESTAALDRVATLGRESTLRLRRAIDLMLAAIERGLEQGRSVTALALRAANLLLRDLGDPGRALRTIQVVLDAESEHPEALELRVDAARAAGDADVLHEALVQSASVQPDPERAVTLWAEAVRVAETALGDPGVALTDLEQLLAVDENDARAWQKLLALRTAGANYEKLAEALGRRATITTDPQERRELRYRLANVLVDKRDRTDDAIAVYQDMLADRPDDREVLHELEVLLRRLERWEEVRDVLERKLDATEGDAERVAVLEELGLLAQGRLDDPIDAIERYQQILVQHPGHIAAEAALERLLSAEERWVDLSQMLESRSQRLLEAGDTDAYRASTSQLAQLLAERLDHPERAQELLKEILEQDPTYVPAILALAAVYEARGEEGAMRLKLQQALQLGPKGSQGAQLHLKLAQLSMEDSERRREHLEQALQLDPTNMDVAKELLGLCRKLERWDQVAYLLELLAGRADEPERKRALVLERVDIMLDPIGDAAGVLRVLAPLYKEVQDDLEINRRIADALFVAERYDEAGGMYTWLIEVGRRSKRSKALGHHLTRMARIQLSNDDADGAKEQLLEAYRIDTTNTETLMTLGGLYERDEQWREALKIYRTMLLQNAEQTGLLRRGDIYINLARAHLALEEKPKAKAMLRRGLEEDHTHPELGMQLEAIED